MHEDNFEGGDAQAGWAGEAFHSRASIDVYLPWIAVGAVVVGTVGAVVGLTQGAKCARSSPWPVIPSDDITPPHGDKLPHGHA